MYVAIKQCGIEQSDGTDKQKTSARHILWRKVVTIATTSYTVGAIFFVRSFLRPFDCVDDGTGRVFMESAPEIECVEGYDSERASNYPSIKYLASFGMIGFMGGFAFLSTCLFKAHTSDTHSLGSLSFLGGAAPHAHTSICHKTESVSREEFQRYHTQIVVHVFACVCRQVRRSVLLLGNGHCCAQGVARCNILSLRHSSSCVASDSNHHGLNQRTYRSASVRRHGHRLDGGVVASCTTVFARRRASVQGVGKRTRSHSILCVLYRCSNMPLENHFVDAND